MPDSVCVVALAVSHVVRDGHAQGWVVSADPSIACLSALSLAFTVIWPLMNFGLIFPPHLCMVYTICLFVFLSWIMYWRSIMCILYQCITLADVSLYPFTKVVLLLLCCCFGRGWGILEWLWCLCCCFNGMRDWLLEVDVHYVCSLSRSLWFCGVCFNHMVKPTSLTPAQKNAFPKFSRNNQLFLHHQTGELFLTAFYTTVTLKKNPFYNQFARKCQCNLNSIHLPATLCLFSVFFGGGCGIDL